MTSLIMTITVLFYPSYLPHQVQAQADSPPPPPYSHIPPFSSPVGPTVDIPESPIDTFDLSGSLVPSSLSHTQREGVWINVYRTRVARATYSARQSDVQIKSHDCVGINRIHINDFARARSYAIQGCIQRGALGSPPLDFHNNIHVIYTAQIMITYISKKKSFITALCDLFTSIYAWQHRTYICKSSVRSPFPPPPPPPQKKILYVTLQYNP